jgi:hypothetical protein
MLLNLILFIIYIGTFLWFVPQLPFVRRAGLADNTQRVLICFKMLSAIVGAAYLGGFPNSDHLAFNRAIAEQFDILINNPSGYFNEINDQYERHGTGGLFEASHSFWGYIRYHLVYMFTAPMNFISGGNFYLNAVIFSSFTFFGHLFFYKVYSALYHGNRWVLVAGCFFIPSLILFTSCVHKDGFVFVSVSILSYVFYRGLRNLKVLAFKYITATVLSLVCIFLLRNYVLVALLPAMLVSYLAHLSSRWRIGITLLSYVLLAILFFLSGSLSNSLNLPEAVVKRKQDFSLLETGKTNLPMNDLEPNAGSFLKNTPQALSHVMLRPHPFEGNGLASMVAGIELYFYILLLGLVLWLKRKTLHSIHTFNIYAVAFFVSMVLIIGFTIPNMGAIVRYRSLLWIFILVPALYQLIKRIRNRNDEKII